jgi:tetratricopeptide (TPR) repeat protein
MKGLLTCLLALAFIAPRPALAHADLLAAIERATRQIESDPKNASLYLWRGDLYRAHADWKEAETDYARVLLLKPDLIEVAFARGKLLFDTGRNAEAQTELDRFIGIRTNNVEALVTRAQVRARLGDSVGAVSDFDRALSQPSRPLPDYYLERAQLLSAQGNFAVALAGLDDGLQRLGPVIALQLYAVELECTRKNYEVALSRLDAIVARSERKERWLVQKAEILAQAGRQSDAMAACGAAAAAIESLPPRQRETSAMRELRQRMNQISSATETMLR